MRQILVNWWPGILYVTGAVCLACSLLLAQDAIVITIRRQDSRELADKWTAYDKAKTEWDAARSEAVKRYTTKETQCGLKFTSTFEYAVPAACPESHFQWGISSTNTVANPVIGDVNGGGWK
jgi:hypothetical protein